MQKNSDPVIRLEVFKRKRDERELSVRDVEELSGVNRTTISNIETAKHIPDGVNLLKLMLFFDLTPNDLVEK